MNLNMHRLHNIILATSLPIARSVLPGSAAHRRRRISPVPHLSQLIRSLMPARRFRPMIPTHRICDPLLAFAAQDVGAGV